MGSLLELGRVVHVHCDGADSWSRVQLSQTVERTGERRSQGVGIRPAPADLTAQY
jgi:hypothetical protein